MPELPEVEILVRHLDSELRNREIRGVSVLRERLVRPNRPGDLEAALVGRRFDRVERRAKYLVFRLRPVRGRTPDLVVGHLGMTGRMYLLPAGRELPRHAAVVLDLDRDRFVFEDVRQFGGFHLDPTVLEGLGPEPLGEEFTVEGLAAGLQSSRQPVKVKLLDQSLVAGLGNIYACEALFRAGLGPQRCSREIKVGEVRRLHQAIRDTLSEAIRLGSSIPLDFQEGEGGLFYYGTEGGSVAPGVGERFWVYDREGQSCRRCGAAIRRCVHAARSTYYCPTCQV